MADTDERPDHPPLEGLGDVRREMTDLYRSFRQMSHDNRQANAKAFGSMVHALNVLYGMWADKRDSAAQKKLGELWNEHQKSKSTSATLPPSH